MNRKRPARPTLDAAAEVIDPETAVRMAALFRVLADPARLRLVSALVGRERCVHELARLLGMSQPAVSHHLRILRFLRLVSYRRAGRHVFYRLQDRHVTDLFRRALSHVSHDLEAREAEAIPS